MRGMGSEDGTYLAMAYGRHPITIKLYNMYLIDYPIENIVCFKGVFTGVDERDRTPSRRQKINKIKEKKFKK